MSYKVRARAAATGMLTALLISSLLTGCGTGNSSGQRATNAQPASPSGPLVAPSTSPAQDAQFLTELTQADSELGTYVTKNGNTALKALLTDGTAFCAFLARGTGINEAMVSLAQGAQGVQSTTHLPTSVATFNAIDAVALLTLCPQEQKLVPADVVTKIKGLGKSLSGGSTTTVTP